MNRTWIVVATLALAGCAGDLSSPSSTEQDTRSCHHNNRFCVDGGTGDMAAPPDMTTTSTPDLAMPAPSPDLAMPAPRDLAMPPATPDLAVACDKPVATTDSGHHNAGTDCSTCHTGGGGPTKWYVSGTLYDSATGNNAVAGATIHVVDAAGQQLTLVSALNGNFYTGTAVTYPITVKASLCPSTVSMSGQVQAPGGCNGCHNSTFRVHLP